MSDAATNETAYPIFTELAHELDLPNEADLTASAPPRFADFLVRDAFSGKHRTGNGETEDGGAPISHAT